MTNQTKSLIYTFDDNYIVPFLVSVFSANKVLGPDLRIVIVQPIQEYSEMGLTKKALHICTECLQVLGIDFEIIRVNVDSFSEDALPLWARFPKTTWLRYYYIFNAEVSQRTIHYVEADMIFLKNTPSIFDIKLFGNAVSGRISPGHVDFEKKWGANITEPWYFNCGVMAINVQKWRERIDQSEWWQVISNYKDFDFDVIEQDALNYFFRGTQVPLKRELNSYPSEFKLGEDAILHFAGHHKPWNFSPRVLRFREKPNVIISMKIWDALEKEVLLTLGKGLTGSDYEWLRKSYPKVKFSTKMSILFPAATSRLFAIKQMLTNGMRKLNENAN